MWEQTCAALRHLGFDHARLITPGCDHAPGRPDKRLVFENQEQPQRNPRGELFLKLPLVETDGTFHGTLILRKDLVYTPFHHYTLRRVEHLRKTLIRYLHKERSCCPTKAH